VDFGVKISVTSTAPLLPPAVGNGARKLLDFFRPISPAALFGAHHHSGEVDKESPLLPADHSSLPIEAAVATPSVLFRWAVCGSAYMSAVHARAKEAEEGAGKAAASGPEHYRLSDRGSESGESDISWDLISVSGLSVSSDADTAEIDDISSVGSLAQRSVASSSTISSVTLSEKSEGSFASFEKID
jgi:hypothetical protein